MTTEHSWFKAMPWRLHIHCCFFIYINEWMELKAKFLIKILSSFWFSRVLCKTVEGGDGKKLITQDKKRTWICEIRLTFVPSCSRVRRQLLHFHVVCKTWSIFCFRKTRCRQLNFSENRNKQCNRSKYMLKKTHGLWGSIFTACRRRRPRLFFLSSLVRQSHPDGVINYLEDRPD